MKAFKGCTNINCKAYKKTHYKDDDEYCVKCGEPLNYVCADCWKVLENNKEKYCVGCSALREQNRQRKIEKVKESAKGVAGIAVAVPPAVAAAGKNADKIVNGAKQIAKAGGEIAKLIKR